MIITISGKPGSGKSTTGKMLAKKLNFKHYSTGQFMRNMAEKRGITLAELSKIAENSSEIDNSIDKWLTQLGSKEDNFVIDTRLGFHFIKKSIKIYLDVSEDKGAERIYMDYKAKKRAKEDIIKSLSDVKKSMQTRIASERKRYMGYYNLDVDNIANFDLVIDATNLTIEQTADKIIEFMKKRKLNYS